MYIPEHMLDYFFDSYIISNADVKGMFYLKEFDASTNQATWTPSTMKAKSFETQSEAEHYCEQLGPRRQTLIVEHNFEFPFG
jgi:hypothetical protein